MIEWLTSIMLFLLCVIVGKGAMEANQTANQMREDRITRGKAFLSHEEWKMESAPEQFKCPECEIESPSNGNCYYCRREQQ